MLPKGSNNLRRSTIGDSSYSQPETNIRLNHFIFQFFINARVPSLSLNFINSKHEEVGPEPENDQSFVYELLQRAFGDKLQVQCLRGREIKDPNTNTSRVVQKLDKTVLNHIESQYTERVLAVGINEEDRTFRNTRSRFNYFVRKCVEKEKKKGIYWQKKQKNTKPGGENTSGIEDDDVGDEEVYDDDDEQ